MTFTEGTYRDLNDHLFRDRRVERGAYLLCRTSMTESETRLLVRKMIPVEKSHILDSSAGHMKIDSRSFLPALKEAYLRKECFIWVHSHPQGFTEHSPQDDREELKLFKTAYTRIRHDHLIHGSIVFSGPERPVARIWLSDLSKVPVATVRVIGRRFAFHFNHEAEPNVSEYFDRQVRAFGEDIQRLLRRLHVGIVGAGGTGSAVAEQLIRLGIGTISVSDGQDFESTNINRVYGSCVSDEGTAKVEIVSQQAARIGLGTTVLQIHQDITYESACAKLRACDLVFGCTDDELGRSLLCLLATYYYIPVFDIGVKIDASAVGLIRSVQGRVTTLMPGAACLYCRGRITTERITAESLQRTSPEHAENLRKQGYAPELDDPDPAVIAFTTAVSAGAICEFLHRLTGFMGPNRVSSETIFLLDRARVRTNATNPREGCFCNDPFRLGRGDTTPLLDTTWRLE